MNPTKAKVTSDGLDTGSRISIGGIMLLTLLVALHAAVGKWNLRTIVMIAPVSLSIASIEILRRMFRLSLVRSMVIGILLGGLCFSLVVGGLSASRSFHLLWDPNWGFEWYTFRAIARWVFNDTIEVFGWYVLDGICVMLGYGAILLIKESSAKRIDRRQLITPPDMNDRNDK